jgi:tetratricopeptide (TPR) repeat protein
VSEPFIPSSQTEKQPAFSEIIHRAYKLCSQGKRGEARALFHAPEIQAAEWERSLYFGQFLLETGHASEAVEQLSLVLDYAQQEQKKQLRSVVCHNLAIAYRNLGYFELAAQFQQYSIAWGDLRSANHQTLEQEMEHLSDDAACDLTGRANDAIIQQDYQLAEQLLNISLSREILYGSLDDQAADWGNLGIVHGLRGNHLRAISYLWKAYLLHKQTSNTSAMGHDLIHLAELFSVVGRSRRTIRCLTRSVICFSLSGHSTEEQKACSRLYELRRLHSVRKHDPLLN